LLLLVDDVLLFFVLLELTCGMVHCYGINNGLLFQMKIFIYIKIAILDWSRKLL